MNIKNLKCWIDKDGNTVYGNKKSYNKVLEYLIEDEPEKVISKAGIKLRRGIHPLFKKMLPLTSKNKFIIENDIELPKDKKIVYIMNHGFKDDIAISLSAIKNRSPYFVFASIPDFYYSMDGFALWLNGVILMDRKDKKSKSSLIPKANYAFKNGLDSIVICPEGVWSKDPNLLMLKLWRGAYEIAKENNALIVPISNYNKDMKMDGDSAKGKKGTCYAKVGKPIDPKLQSEEETIRMMRDALATGRYELMDQYGHASRSDFGDNPDEYWDKYVSELISTTGIGKKCKVVDKEGNSKIADVHLYDYEIENNADFIDKKEPSEEIVFESTNKLPYNEKTRDVLVKTLTLKPKKRYYKEIEKK